MSLNGLECSKKSIVFKSRKEIVAFCAGMTLSTILEGMKQTRIDERKVKLTWWGWYITLHVSGVD